MLLIKPGKKVFLYTTLSGVLGINGFLNYTWASPVGTLLDVSYKTSLAAQEPRTYH